jgi:hypothetical protein
LEAVNGTLPDKLSLAEVQQAGRIGHDTPRRTTNAHWRNGNTLPEIKEIFAGLPGYRRTGIINAYEDPTFRKAYGDLVAGVTIGTCCASPFRTLQRQLAILPGFR